MRLLQRRLAAVGGLLGELHLGDGDQDFGAGLEVRRLQQRLLLGGAVGRHHRQRVDQRLVGRALDALPVGLEIVGLEESGQRFEQRLAVDLVLALAGDEIVGERRDS